MVETSQAIGAMDALPFPLHEIGCTRDDLFAGQVNELSTETQLITMKEAIKSSINYNKY